MFTNYLNSIKGTKFIHEEGSRTTPVNIYNKISRKYQTPHKSGKTTNVTKGNTLSLSTFTNHQPRSTYQKQSTMKSFHIGNAKTQQKTIGVSTQKS